jgi:hypothetical protein
VAIDVANMLLLRGKITPEQFQKFKDDLTAQIGALGGTVPATTTDVDVTVNPKPVVPDDKKEDAKKSIIDQWNDFVGANPITPTTPVTPTLTTTVTLEEADKVSTMVLDTLGAQPPATPEVQVTPTLTVPTTAAEAQEMADNLLEVQTNLGLVQTAFTTFASNAQPGIDKLNEIATKLDNIKTKSLESFSSMDVDLLAFTNDLKTHVDTTIVPKLKEIIDQIFAIDLKMLGWVLVMPINLNLNANAWDAWGKRVKTDLNDVKDLIKTIDDAVIRATNNINTMNGTNVNNPFDGGGGGGNPQGRAAGGPVSSRNIYQVIEEGIPELFHSGGKTYLIPASNGYVTPISDLGTGSMQRGLSAMPSMMGRSGSPLTNGSSNVNITEGDIVIQINGSNVSNPASIAAAVRAEVRAELDSRNSRVRSTLRTGHR